MQGQMFPCRLLGLTITGVTGSRAEVYMGAQRIDQTARGQSNTADYSTPREVPMGVPLSVKWIGQAANASGCTATFVIDR
jgi:hypothetical protein